MTQRFAYRARPRHVLIPLALGFPAMTVGAFGLVTGRGISRAGQDLAPALALGVFAALLLLGIVLAVWGLRAMMAGDRPVVVGASHLEVPRSPTSQRIVRIPLDRVQGIRADVDGAQGEYLALRVAGQRPIRLARAAFDSPESFDACREAIEEASSSAALRPTSWRHRPDEG